MALGMSQGNLNYHFKTKPEIIEELYFELVEKMNSEMQKMAQNSSILSMLYTSAEMSMLNFYEYRFLMRDMYFIFRENDKIKQHYLELQKMRKEQFKMLFKTMIESQILRSEEFPDEYERLYERMNILGDNWINAFELLKKNVEEPVKYYQLLLFEAIYPYLTSKGKAEFNELAK
jgi:AcrR family transcriptional regulator